MTKCRVCGLADEECTCAPVKWEPRPPYSGPPPARPDGTPAPYATRYVQRLTDKSGKVVESFVMHARPSVACDFLDLDRSALAALEAIAKGEQ